MAKKKQAKKKTSNKKIEEVEEIKEEVTEETESIEEEVEEVKEEKSTKKKRKDSKKSNKNADKKVKTEKSHWFKDLKAEIKKIVWPSGKRLFDNVVVVLSMVFIVTLIIFLLDLGLKQLSNLEVNGVNELKTKVVNQLENSTENTTTSEDVLVNGTDGAIATSEEPETK